MNVKQAGRTQPTSTCTFVSCQSMGCRRALSLTKASPWPVSASEMTSSSRRGTRPGACCTARLDAVCCSTTDDSAAALQAKPLVACVRMHGCMQCGVMQQQQKQHAPLACRALHPGCLARVPTTSTCTH